MTNKYDVAIVGAGPAGTAAATTLANAGLSVLVVDKARFPRDKTCGDGLTTAALRHLQSIDFDPTTVASWTSITHTIWRSPSGHTIELDVPDDKGLRIAVARRRDLDSALVDHARSAGAEIREDTTLGSARINGDHVELEFGDDKVSADFAIGADGIYSPLRKALIGDSVRYLGDIHAFRQYFTGVTGVAAKSLWVSFDKDILPGYIWAFPLGGGAVNVGFGIERHANRSVQWMRDAWTDILQRPHVREALGGDAVAEAPHRAWPIPAGIHHAQLTHRDRVMFVGDAARSVDPLTGEGIAQALETGSAAAGAIVKYQLNPSKAASAYRNQIRRSMAHDHKFSSLLAGIVRHDAGARLAIRMAPLGPQRGRYAMRWVFEDNPRAALLTPWRWRERFSDKPTVYPELVAQ